MPATFVTGSPAILRGTIDISRYAGVVVGSGVPPSARIANGAAIQSAIDAAISRNKYIEAPPGDYEFSLAGGLVLNADRAVWRGTPHSNLIQFASNAPVITIGSAISNGNGAQMMSVNGLRARYGVDQTGNAEANAIVFASSWLCEFSNIKSGEAYNGNNKPYRSVYFNGGGQDKWWFSNILRNSAFHHAQHEIWRHALLSTGCVYENIYIGGGNPNITAYPPTNTNMGVVTFQKGGGERGQGSVFNQFNIEWVSGNHILYLNNTRQYVFNGLHIEGCALAGNHPSFIYLNYSEIQGAGCTFENCRIPTGLTGSAPEIFGGWGPSKVTIDGMRLGWLKVTGDDTNIEAQYNMMHFGGERDGYGSRMALRNMYIEGGGAYGGNTLIPPGDTPYPTSSGGDFRLCGGNYIYDGNEQYLDSPGYSIDADFTVYGSCRNPSIRYPAALAANRTLVLSDRRGSTGWLNNAKVPAGALVHLYRANGTAANTVLVKNLTAGGATIATSSTADVHYRFQFDGTNWQQVQ